MACDACHTSSSSVVLYACTGCRRVRYCNRDCQKKAWPSHRKDCFSNASDTWAAILPELLAQILDKCLGQTLCAASLLNKHWAKEAAKIMDARLYAGLTVVKNRIGGYRMEWSGVHTKGSIDHIGIHFNLVCGEELLEFSSHGNWSSFFAIDDFKKEWPSPEEYERVTLTPGLGAQIFDEIAKWYTFENERLRIQQLRNDTLPATTSCYRDREHRHHIWLIDDVDAVRYELRRVGAIAQRLGIAMWFV